MTDVVARRVESGSIVALRLFEIACAIDLAAAERLWAAHAGAGSRRSRLSMTPAKAVTFDVSPLLLNMDAVDLDLDQAAVRLGVTARLYDFGVVAFALRLPVGDLEWPQYCRLLNALDAVVGPKAQYGNAAQPDPWRALHTTVISMLVAALVKATDTTMQEDYLLGLFDGWSEPMTSAEVQARVDLVPLPSGKRRPLSEAVRRDLLRHRYDYFDDDLVVLTWNRAFIYEPRRETDVSDVIEVANAQLLELRY